MLMRQSTRDFNCAALRFAVGLRALLFGSSAAVLVVIPALFELLNWCVNSCSEFLFLVLGVEGGAVPRLAKIRPAVLLYSVGFTVLL